MIIDFSEKEIRICGLPNGEELHKKDVEEVIQELEHSKRLVLIGLRINSIVARWISLALDQKKEVIVHQRRTKRIRISKDYPDEQEFTEKFQEQGVIFHTTKATMAEQMGEREFRSKDFIMVYPDPESVLTVLYGLGAKRIVTIEDIHEVRGHHRTSNTSTFTRLVSNGLDFYVPHPAQSMLGFTDKFTEFFESIIHYAHEDTSAEVQESIYAKYKTARFYGNQFLANIEQYNVFKKKYITMYDFSQLKHVIPLDLLSEWHLGVPIRVFKFKRKVVIEYHDRDSPKKSLHVPDLRTVYPEAITGGKRILYPTRVEIDPRFRKEYMRRLRALIKVRK